MWTSCISTTSFCLALLIREITAQGQAMVTTKASSSTLRKLTRKSNPWLSLFLALMEPLRTAKTRSFGLRTDFRERNLDAGPCQTYTQVRPRSSLASLFVTRQGRHETGLCKLLGSKFKAGLLSTFSTKIERGRWQLSGKNSNGRQIACTMITCFSKNARTEKPGAMRRRALTRAEGPPGLAQSMQTPRTAVTGLSASRETQFRQGHGYRQRRCHGDSAKEPGSSSPPPAQGPYNHTPTSYVRLHLSFTIVYLVYPSVRK